MYKCLSCKRQFLGGDRVNSDLLWQEYVEGNQTYRQLALKYGCSLKTIQRRIDKVQVSNLITSSREVIVLMDTTYFGRTFGVMLFRDAYTCRNLYKIYVKHETNQAYINGINYLQNQGFIINAIICDGRKGLIQTFDNIPIQMCQFHQVAIITRYLTRRPKLVAAIRLRELTLLLAKTDKESFIGGLASWYIEWKQFLDERTMNKDTGKSFILKKN